ncbi:MAG: hypothetical protein JWN36_3181 [Microbacteriaceae bacterium]|nr:hypothetical protein [Microbacteriaceae bacterium]
MKSPRRLKNLTLLAGVVLAGLILLTWTGQWFSLTLDGRSSSHSTIAVSGDVAAPALIALALANLALVAALAISGPVIRLVLAIVEVVLGFTVGLSAVAAIADPVHASASAISAATGVTGDRSLDALVTSVSTSPWPWFAAVVGVLVMALGVFLAITGRAWPGSSRKYQAARLETTEPGENPVADWDTLSGGSDPTAR